MSQKATTPMIIALSVVLVLVTCGLVGGTIYAVCLPEHVSEQETLILGQSLLVPGAPGVLHVQVQQPGTAAPIEGADVQISLRPRGGGRAELLFEGATEADGRVSATFIVPDVADPEQQIVFQTRSAAGRDTLELPVIVARGYRVLLTTDKPIYQPGQQILIRALALGTFDRHPCVDGPIEVTVADPKGNKVFRETATTSAYGVAAWAFQLADEVNYGNFKITATLHSASSEAISSEKTVLVKPYVLPKFKVSASTYETFYQPGQRISGEVEATYSFGKAVAGAQARVTGWVYDVERQQILDLLGRTDVAGRFAFEFQLPAHLVGGLERGVADLILEVAVTDRADHTEQVSTRIPIAQEGILIEAVPESGDLKPGLDNILYLLTIFLLTTIASNQSEPHPLVLVSFFAAYLVLPLAFGARAAGFGIKREGWASVAMGFVALLSLLLFVGPILVGLTAAPMLLGGVGAASGSDRQDAVFDEPMPPALAEASRAARPTAMPAFVQNGADASALGVERQEIPLLRQFFPETMYWNPEAITDAQGRWQADLNLAHTITTWRLTALASSQDGRIGSTAVPIRVFQDFFVDIDLPLALTQGDEVSMPVAVCSYLQTGQEVQLTLEEQDWFELLGEPTQVVQAAPHDVTVIYFPIRVTATEGRFRPMVSAIGERMSDATTLRHDVQVLPNGLRFDQTASDRLNAGITSPAIAEQLVSIPQEIIPGTARIVVKVYPGILSQVVEGLDALLRMPFGCFEQTSSATYPNVLVLDYLQRTGKTSPEVRMKAEQYINVGYQRLTTFEVPGGGFSLFGDLPADRVLTAYGLMQFTDMSRVYPVDEAVVDRTARWLLSQQRGDGSWGDAQGLVHEQSWSNRENERLPVTAYIVWALTEAGYEDEPGTQRGLDYIREFWREAEDTYALALAANALAAADPEGDTTKAALAQLAEKVTRQGNGAYWQSGVGTFMGATAQTGSIETTALAAYAFLRAEQQIDLANMALNYLIQQKDSYGTWHSTQATILTLKALLLSVRKGEAAHATVTVSLNGNEMHPIRITPDSSDVLQQVSFADKAVVGHNRLRIEVQGRGNLMYQVSTHYYLPWDKTPVSGREPSSLDIDLAYDRTELAVNDVVTVSVHVELRDGAARQAIVDLGIPPGFEVFSDDLAGLVAQHSNLPADYEGPTFSRVDLTGRQIIVYLEGLMASQPLDFHFRLRARYPIKAQTPPSSAYDYYNPAVSAVAAPMAIEVRA